MTHPDLSNLVTERRRRDAIREYIAQASRDEADRFYLDVSRHWSADSRPLDMEEAHNEFDRIFRDLIKRCPFVDQIEAHVVEQIFDAAFNERFIELHRRSPPRGGLA